MSLVCMAFRGNGKVSKVDYGNSKTTGSSSLLMVPKSLTGFGKEIPATKLSKFSSPFDRIKTAARARKNKENRLILFNYSYFRHRHHAATNRLAAIQTQRYEIFPNFTQIARLLLKLSGIIYKFALHIKDNQPFLTSYRLWPV